MTVVRPANAMVVSRVLIYARVSIHRACQKDAVGSANVFHLIRSKP